MKAITEYFAREDAYPDLDVDGAAGRLSRAIQCRTVDRPHRDATLLAEFDRLHAIIKEGYPHVMKQGTFEVIAHGEESGDPARGRALLITIPGSDPSLRPCLYMSHQDVVPVVEGTEKDWTHDAFSGAVADGYIWGRGTLDIKQMVFGILEAAEYLLAHGRQFKRTACLAFGDDEETRNWGAEAIAKTLEQRGVRLEFLLDEGGGRVEDGAPFGAPGVAISRVDLMEKGYADVELSVESRGGHSSRPFGGTSLALIARAIAGIADHPFPARLPTVLRATFQALAPHITEEPLKTLVQDVPGNAEAIAAWCLERPETFPYVTTTIAPTMIEGGSSACNVMPQNMRAAINFRINEGDGTEAVMAHCRAHDGSDRVKLRFLQANEHSAVARMDGYGYARLVESMEAFYPGVLFVPSMSVGATDARRYERICDTCLRCAPFMAELEDARRGVHGTDERLLLRAYAQGIRVLIHLMERANVEP